MFYVLKKLLLAGLPEDQKQQEIYKEDIKNELRLLPREN